MANRIKWWLISVGTMIFLMVFIGGVTRLTDSGLSMVDWKPIMGIFPPTSQADWESAFKQYQQFPEFKLVNQSMDLSGFKRIYFWEYFHRLFGRLIGLVFFLPFVYFLSKKVLNSRQIKRYSVAFILGGAQGLMGWYMVKSGLVNRPDVSHFRLAAHLSLAFIIIGYVYWQILELKNGDRKLSLRPSLALGFVILLFSQIIYGAFVAGLDAGLTHNTFPKMGRFWFPRELWLTSLGWLNIFENPVTLQFIHRYLGISLVLVGLLLWFYRKNIADSNEKQSLKGILIVLLLQVTLGVLTLIWYVPIWTASMHQLGACLLLLLKLRALFFSQAKPLDMT